MTDENVTLIVRSIGERTTEKCISYLEKQFHTKDVKVIRNVTPSSEAVREMMDIGSKENKKWMLQVDADMFFFEEKLPLLFDTAEKILQKNGSLFCINLSMYDNFLGYSRALGYLYYTKYLDKALKFAPNNDLRPNTYVLRNMSFAGYPSYRLYETVGIHDFFQSYQSIVAKGILHCKKHASIAAEMREMWERNRDTNIEFDYLCKAAEISDTIAPEVLAGVNGDYIKELVDKYIAEFPPQPELTNEEIDEALARYQNEVVYEQIKYQRPVHVGLFQKIGRKVDKLLLC